jgi:nitroreductase
LKLGALGGTQVPRPAMTNPEQLEHPAALVRLKLGDVIVREGHDLGQRQQPCHRELPQSSNRGCDSHRSIECRPLRFSPMDVEDAIRTRRTHKAFGPDPLPRELIDELLELARWVPNHNLTNPWRFRVLGPEALGALKEAAGPEGATKLDRAPTLIAASATRSGDPVQDEEDLCATACATYAVLLAAHSRGLAGYWRTPGVLRTREGLGALGIGPDERFVALIHLGWPRQGRQPPERLPPRDVVSYLD